MLGAPPAFERAVAHQIGDAIRSKAFTSTPRTQGGGNADKRGAKSHAGLGLSGWPVLYRQGRAPGADSTPADVGAENRALAPAGLTARGGRKR